jgi:hypothetical protein
MFLTFDLSHAFSRRDGQSSLHVSRSEMFCPVKWHCERRANGKRTALHRGARFGRLRGSWSSRDHKRSLDCLTRASVAASGDNSMMRRRGNTIRDIIDGIGISVGGIVLAAWSSYFTASWQCQCCLTIDRLSNTLGSISNILASIGQCHYLRATI